MAQKLVQKKVCMLGSYAVGKTSLVQRFVKSIFDERYLMTLGVKTDKKLVEVDGHQVMLMLWDVAGSEDYFRVPMSYVRGAAGYLLVVDGTRPATLEGGLELRQDVEDEYGSLPMVACLNKVDLVQEWKLTGELVQPLEETGCPVLETSAKTGQGVEEAFLELARLVL